MGIFGKKKRVANLKAIADELTNFAADAGIPVFFINIGEGAEASDKIICHVGVQLDKPIRNAIAGCVYVDEKEYDEEISDFVTGKTKNLTMITMKELKEFEPSTDSGHKADEFIRNTKEILAHIGSVMEDK